MKLPAAKNDEYKIWSEEWLSEITKTRATDRVFREKILNDSVYAFNKHFNTEAASWAQWVRESCGDWHYFDLFLLPWSTVRGSRFHNSLIPYRSDSVNWYIVSSSLWRRCLQLEWQTTHTTLSLTLNPSPILLYPLIP